MVEWADLLRWECPPPILPTRLLELTPVGTPINLRFVADLRVSRGQLKPGAGTGTEVHAAAFLRKREIVFDASLQGQANLRRILVHEIFHFVWHRLGNQRRATYAALLQNEAYVRVPGELGWSAEERKNGKWPAYCCESFCDTAAYLLSGVTRHPEYTLPPPFRRRRRELFRTLIPDGRVSL